MITMKITYQFDFLNQLDTQNALTLKDGFTVRKPDLDDCLKGIQTVIEWNKSSPYTKCFRTLHVLINDTEYGSFVEVDHEKKSVFLSLNVFNFMYDYRQDRAYTRLVFGSRTDTLTLSEFTSFFFWHELGHIVHASLLFPGSLSLFDKMEGYVHRYGRYYDHNDGLHPARDDNDLDVQRAYRQIPSEIFADQFAWNQLKNQR